MTIRPPAQYALVFVLAVAVRGLALWWYFPPQGWEAFDFGFELGQVSANIAEGRGMSSPFGPGSSPTAWFMPAAPMLWAGLFSALGTLSPASLAGVYAIDAACCGLAACAYLFFSKLILPQGAARTLPLVAVLATLVVPEHFVTLTRPWYWSLQKLGVALMLATGLVWQRSPTARAALTFGAVSGATMLVNSVPLLLFAAILALVVLRSPRRAAPLPSALLACAAALLCLTPWMIRNWSAFGAFVPLRQNSWAEIRQGNCEGGSIIQGVDSVHPNTDRGERALYADLGERRYEERAKAEALGYMQEHLGLTAKRTLLRASLFWLSDLFHEGVYGDRSWADKSAWERSRDVVIFICAVVPLFLAALTLARGWLREAGGAWMLTCALLVLPLPYYVTHIHPTYFSTVKPLVILVAALGAGEALRRRGADR